MTKNLKVLKIGIAALFLLGIVLIFLIIKNA
jgi:hypothetical protein